MSALNSAVLREILAEIFFSEEDREENIKYIVPKQGNWFNPKEEPGNDKDTWIAYRIKRSTSVMRAIPSEEEIEDTLYAASWVPELVEIELQLVGSSAEELAGSVKHWPSRSDVAEAFDRVSGVLRQDRISVESSWFKQEGGNTIYAYNVTFRVYCANVAVSSAERLTTVNYTRGGTNG